MQKISIDHDEGYVYFLFDGDNIIDKTGVGDTIIDTNEACVLVGKIVGIRTNIDALESVSI